MMGTPTKAHASSARGSRPCDSLTVLTTCRGKIATKRVEKTVHSVVVHNYDAGYWFGVIEPVPLHDIRELSAILTTLESFPDCLVIRGVPRADSSVGNWVQRTGSGDQGNFHTPAGGHNWMLVDFDKIALPLHLDVHTSAVAVCEYLIRCLPTEFHNASYHWSLSSSAGLGDPSKVSMHIWFWLKKPISDITLKAWANAVNLAAGYKLVDPALFQHVQPHFTAAPIFIGLPDPFPVRSGLVEKDRDEVDLKLPQCAAPIGSTGAVGDERLAKASGTASSSDARGGAGFEYRLSTIGDHAGGLGFHGPIIAAAASYVATHGAAATDIDQLFESLSARVLSADATHHDRAYVERMSGRDHIVPAIESAIKKFGSQPIRRRKTKLHEGIEPHFKSQTISVAEAQRQLADLVKLGL